MTRRPVRPEAGPEDPYGGPEDPDGTAVHSDGAADPRRVVIIMSDTFRRDHLAAYGDPAPWKRRKGRDPFIETPALDRLLAESAAFERFYASSYPTVPCRTDLFTGRWSFPRRGWGPLRADDRTLAEVLGSADVVSEMIFDTPMLAAGDYNFHRGFTGWDFVRGQHADAWDTSPTQPSLPAPAWKLRSADATRLYLRNSRGRQVEGDWMCARTMRRAEEWLTTNAGHPRFLLWVDTWDPHEPFDAPDDLLRRYLPGDYHGDRVIYPQYGRPSLDEAELDFVRASYAAKVGLVDRAVGRLLDHIEALGLAPSTLVIFLTDHGHLFGEHDLEGKPTGPLGWLYEPTIRVPLLIRHPQGHGQGTRPNAIAQHVDVLPTVLDFLGIPHPAGLEGRSLLPELGVPDAAMAAATSATPEYAVSGRRNEWHGDAAAFDGAAGRPSRAEPISVSGERFTLMCGPLGTRRLHDRAADPGQAREAPPQPEARRMEEYLFDFLRARDAPDGFMASYLAYGGRTGSTRGGNPDRGLFETRLLVTEPAPDRVVAFTSLADARACLDRPDVAELEMASVRALLGRDRILVYLGQQYYWLSDLIEEPWAELLGSAAPWPS